MDPTNLSRTCTKALSDANVNSNGTPTGITSGCMKFYIYDSSGGTYKMILDHSTSGSIAWANQEDFLAAGGTQTDWDAGKYALKGAVTANKRLTEDTVGWIGGPRLITIDEVAHIIGADLDTTIKFKSTKTVVAASSVTDTNTQIGHQFYLDGGRNSNPTTYSSTNGWTKQYATTAGSSNYYWLYDYTVNCTGWKTDFGCKVRDNNKYPYPTKTSTTTAYIYSYWTATSFTNSNVFNIDYKGEISNFQAYKDGNYSIRPVIEVPKSVID